MPKAPLPSGANYEHLTNQARTLLESFRSVGAGAATIVVTYFSDTTDVGIIQAQLVIAREYSFESWRELLLEVSRLRDDSTQLESADARGDNPLQCECVVQSNHNVATFIKELVLTHPAKFLLIFLI